MRVAIAQPMLFPWPGVLEKIKRCDTYVYLDSVQFSKGSFTNRIQIKTAHGQQWLTVPLWNMHLGQLIREVKVHPFIDWRERHIHLLEDAYRAAPYKHEMLRVVEDVYSADYDNISELSIASIERVCSYFSLRSREEIVRSSSLSAQGEKSRLVLSILQQLGAETYICGKAGGQHYLDHKLLEEHGISIEYMHHLHTPYKQLHGPFVPYVSVLDLIANEGHAGSEVLNSTSVNWRRFGMMTASEG